MGGGPNGTALLERARRCHAERAWGEAFEHFARADREHGLGIDDLERYGWTAALVGRDDDMLDVFRRLYHGLVAEDRCRRAARTAFWIGFRLFLLGEAGSATGWLERARRIVDREPEECVEEGYLLIPTVARHLAAGDNPAAAEAAARIADIGERYDDADLVALARNLEGRALVRRGDVAPGIRRLDEAMVAAASDELSPIVTGLIYCTVIETCQQICALDRAREWTAALTEWCEAQPSAAAFTGACMVHRAEILRLGGDWGGALEEVRTARERLSPTTDPIALSEAHYQQAEIHRLRGETGAAEAAYREASRVGGEPQPGLALLRLAQGRADEAVAAIRRALDTTTATWRRARFLPAYVETLLGAGELEEARTACAELDALSERFETEILCAMAAHARGAVLLAAGDAQGAVQPLADAFGIWQRAGAPYIAARIRVLLGRAYGELGDRDGAELEVDAARCVFEELGAAPDLASLQERPAAPSVHGLTIREREVLKKLASGMTNKAIARALCVSERTIDRHVSNIFGKLHVCTRAAATAFAYEHDLV